MKNCVKAAHLFLAALPHDIRAPDEGRVNDEDFCFVWLDELWAGEPLFILHITGDDGWHYFSYQPDGRKLLRVGAVETPLSDVLLEDLRARV